jgi:hypothetical protein
MCQQFYECKSCGIRYDHTRDIHWHHFHLCSHKCLEDFKEDHPEIVKEPNGNDLDLFTWAVGEAKN